MRSAPIRIEHPAGVTRDEFRHLWRICGANPDTWRKLLVRRARSDHDFFTGDGWFPGQVEWAHKRRAGLNEHFISGLRLINRVLQIAAG